MRAESKSARTIEERIAVTRRCLDATGKAVADVGTMDIAEWLGGLDVSASTRATYHAHLRAFFRWAMAMELIERNPMDALPPSRRPRGVPRPIATAQVRALLGACNRRRTRAMVKLALFAGLRVHEIAKLRGEDIDLGEGTLYVDGKGGVRAVIPLHPEIAEEVPHLPRRGYWFPSRAGGHARSRSVSDLIRRAMRRAGFEAQPHQLRHWYGTALLDARVDIRVVQELMRHQSIQSTTIYTRVSDTQRRAGISALAA